MSIDADLNQRIITEKDAQAKRKKLNMETEFYGAMDGAGKFIKGDVIFRDRHFIRKHYFRFNCRHDAARNELW